MNVQVLLFQMPPPELEKTVLAHSIVFNVSFMGVPDALEGVYLLVQKNIDKPKALVINMF